MKTKKGAIKPPLMYQNTPGISCPVTAYAPTAATTPSIARRPFRRSARSQKCLFIIFSP